VISTALKNEKAQDEWVIAAIQSASIDRGRSFARNRVTGKMARCDSRRHGHNGFGLLGHAREMALGNPQMGIVPVSIDIDHSAFTFLPGALEAAKAGQIPGGLKNNREFVGQCAEFASSVPPEHRDLFFDPQTSGGLLIAISADSTEECRPLSATVWRTARRRRKQE
jgi:selenide,water dikinase